MKIEVRHDKKNCPYLEGQKVDHKFLNQYILILTHFDVWSVGRQDNLKNKSTI